jgi:hypothetical protein
MTLTPKNCAPGLLGLMMLAAPACASDATLFTPTPAAAMRELSTDRPDKTESAYTVDAGHFQLEMDIANFTRDRVQTATENTKTETYGVVPFNVKAGLTDSIDLQILVDTYSRQRVTDYTAGSRTTISGFGDITLRSKINVWGNNGGDTALAVMPFVKFPTAENGLGNGKVEGGVIVPLAVALPHGFGLGLMTEVDLNHDTLGGGYHPEFINSVTVGTDLSDSVGMYVEFFTSRSAESGAQWNNTADLGFTFALADNIQLDTGVNVGVTRAADDINAFVGISFRW